MNILIVENDLTVQNLLGRFVRKEFPGCTVKITGSVQTALELLAESPQDRVFCDFDLDDTTGDYVFDWVKTNSPELLDRFVFVTSQEEVRCLHSRVAIKPCGLTEIRQAMYQ